MYVLDEAQVAAITHLLIERWQFLMLMNTVNENSR